MARNIYSCLRLKGTLVAQSPLHVGGHGDDVNTDLPLARDGAGHLYIPGTSLAGASPALNNSVWSRQVVGGPNERQLTTGTLCYAAFRDGQVTALFPVMISRRLFESSPLSLLPEPLRPATSRSELSPADRVFGWVNQKGKGAYRGNIRFGQVKCETANPIENFGTPGLPLTILGQPKPQQARFYVAATPSGEAQLDRLPKEQVGYRSGKGLRGRKVYPHHGALPPDYWDDPVADRTQQPNGRHFQEYRRPQLNGQEQRDNQNRSIQGWVKQGTEFTFESSR